MGRLIDADALEKVMSEDWFLEILATQDSKSAIKKYIVNMIDSVPLAYNLDDIEVDQTDYANIELYNFWLKHQWIPCSERLPDVETKVLIFAKRKYIGGGFKNIITTAMYEDGTVLENDSEWRWEDLDAEWNEEEDCYIIPEGWWEDKAYNPDGELNNAVDDEVIAWMPLPEPYQQTNERSE